MTTQLHENKSKILTESQQNANQTRTIQCFLMRHAQSKFNQAMEQSAFQSLSMDAKNTYQMNLELIDCEVTEKGIRQIKQLKNYQKNEFSTQFDIIFVSPLNRTLETAKQLLDIKKLKYKKIIVLPGLTQVVSKICDFSHQIEKKISKYHEFDFHILKGESKKNYFWQDAYIDSEFQSEIDRTKHHGQRYVKILDKIFPKPLESVQNCVKRSLDVLKEVKKISLQENAERVLVISHNRILKNMLTKGIQENIKEFKIMKNCQLRKIII